MVLLLLLQRVRRTVCRARTTPGSATRCVRRTAARPATRRTQRPTATPATVRTTHRTSDSKGTHRQLHSSVSPCCMRDPSTGSFIPQAMRLLGEDPAHRLEGCSVCTYSLLFTGCLNGCSACTYSLCVIYRVSGQVLGLYLLAVCYLQGVQIGAWPVLTRRMLLTGCPDWCSACTYSLYVIDRVYRQVLGLYLLGVCYLQGVQMGAQPVLTHCVLLTGCLNGCSVCTYSLYVIDRVSRCMLGLYSPTVLLTGCPDGCSVCTYSPYVIDRVSGWVLGLYLLAVCYLQGVQMGAWPVLTWCVLLTGCLNGCSVCTYSPYVIDRVSGWVLGLYLLAVCYLQGVQMGAWPVLTRCMLFTGCLNGCSACTYLVCVIDRVSRWVLGLYLLGVCYLQGVRMGAWPVLTWCVLLTGCLNGCSVCTYSPYVIDRVSGWVLGLYLLAVCYLQGVQMGAWPVLTRCMLFTGCPDGCSACTYLVCVIDRVSRWVLGLYLLGVCYLQGVQMGARSVLTWCVLFTRCPDRCLACTYLVCVIDRVSGRVLGLYLLGVCYLQGVRTGARSVLTRRPLVTRFARMDGVTLGTLRTRTTTGRSVSVRKASPTTSYHTGDAC